MGELQRILAIDVGAGTQDILLFEEGREIENCPRMVMPSPTVLVARKIAGATREGTPIHLHGYLMGGGPCSRALKNHLAEGYPAYAQKEAALTFGDNLEKVKALGLQVVEDQDPVVPGARRIKMGDVDLEKMGQALSAFGLERPGQIAVAVQDHGHSPDGSNRLFRFRHWKSLVDGSGSLWDLAYREPPSYLTRMKAITRQAPGCLVMDTGPAAILGILQDDRVAPMAEEGFIALNVGNAHTIAFLIQGSRILGVLEEHTGLLTPGRLAGRLDAFSSGTLSHEEVFSEGGHGCHIHSDYRKGKPYKGVAVTGPRRGLAKGLGLMASPHGDMMLTGCFGLVSAVLRT